MSTIRRASSPSSARCAQLQRDGRLLAYHDRSDGGLFATLCEMAFAGHCGVTVNLDVLAVDPVAADWGDFKIRPEQVSVRRNELMLKALFAEELGAVLQITCRRQVRRDGDVARRPGSGAVSQIIGKPNAKDVVEFWCDARPVFSRAARRTAEDLERDLLAHRAAARQPGLRRCRVRAGRLTPDDRGLSMQLTLRRG